MRKRYGAKVDFVRLDVTTSVARELMRRWGVKLNSSYLLFDHRGVEVWRSSMVPFPFWQARRVLEALLEKNA